MQKDLIEAADLFAGAGGTSTGLARACKKLGKRIDLVAINHWPRAITTHRFNHPWARHMCQDIRDVEPARAVPSGHLDLLVASPCCTHYSMARGGKPVDDQKRSTPRNIRRWLKDLDVSDFLMENVREFQHWGPLYSSGPKKDMPIPERRGEFYREFVESIEELGYTVGTQVLNSADYGAATSRRRLFLIARKHGEIRFPKPTHTKESYRAAREIIDWSIEGDSIFTRKKPLAKTTLARIAAGLRKFGGEPFLAMLYGTNDARSIERPVPTVTASGTHIALCEPFVLQQQSGGVPRSVDDPLPTIATRGAQALIQPFIVPFFGERDGQDPRTHSIEEPLPTPTSHGSGGLVEPFIIPLNHGEGDLRSHSVQNPLPTITGVDAWGLIEPFLVKYFGTAKARPVTEPLDTVTTKDRFALVEPKAGRYGLDIRFRMLQPHELARAMGFEDSYKFSGTCSEVVKQIGNAVEVRTAEALCTTLLEEARLAVAV